MESLVFRIEFVKVLYYHYLFPIGSAFEIVFIPVAPIM